MSVEISLRMASRMLPKRPCDGHKGTFGHVFVIGGSIGFTGAPRLAGLGAARSGAGLVTVGVPEPVYAIVASSLLECMTLLLPATEAGSVSPQALGPALDFASTKDAVVLGPGLSQNQGASTFVEGFVRSCPAPLVIDADGLNCLGPLPEALKNTPAPRILTPHPGEMARLTGRPTSAIQGDREAAAAGFAQDFGCVVVLKGHRTVVASPDGCIYSNPTGNSGLASGGTGDVLAGLLGGLIAQGMGPVDAAILGVYLHGLAGDIAAERMTERAMLAGDVVDALPSAWRTLERGQD